MKTTLTRYTNLHRFILFATVCTFLLIIAGGLVTSTDSGLSVPDWPNTYGHFMFAFPLEEMVGGILYEHSHRMIASFVGFLTLIVAIWLWRREERRWVRWLGIAALGAVIAQGTLGGLTVLFLLPTAISVSHATLAQTFFAIMATLALVTSRWWREEQPTLKANENRVPLTQLSLLTTGAVYVQLILGALMRHTQSGLVVPDFPLAFGQLFPSLSPESLEQYNQQLIQSDIRLAADGVVTSTQVIIHMLHRFWGVLVAFMVVWLSVRLMKYRRVTKRFMQLSIAILSLVITQVTLGAFTVLSWKAVEVTTAHVAVGALLLMTCLMTSLHLVRLYGVRRKPAVIPLSVPEVAA